MRPFLASLPDELVRALHRDWLHVARDDQLPPETGWVAWLLMGGRGSGKTRAGAEWVRALALGDPAFTGQAVGRIALVAETFSDLRDVMVDGPSGLLALPGPRPAWQPSRRRLEWPNGAVALGFYISISGIATFKNAQALRDIIRDLPLERLLVETDAPYLAPVPMRGKTNEPAWVRHVGEFVAKLRGVPVETVAEQTTDNFFRLFKHIDRNAHA